MKTTTTTKSMPAILSPFYRLPRRRSRRSGTGLKCDTTATLGSAKLREHEANDCTVRGIMNWLHIDYDEAHSICEEAGRRRRQGYWTERLVDHLTEHYGFKVKNVHCPVKVVDRISPTHARWGWDDVKQPVCLYPTLTKFIKAHPKGNFLVSNRGHTFVVRDSVVYDTNHRTGRTRIHQAFRLVPDSEIPLEFPS